MKVGDLIPIGGSGNVKKSEVLTGKTYSSDEGVDLVGTMANRGTLNRILTKEGDTVNLSSGYYSGGSIKTQITNLTASNIKKGINVGGVVGEYVAEYTIKQSANLRENNVPEDKEIWSVRTGETVYKTIPKECKKLMLTVMPDLSNSRRVVNLWFDLDKLEKGKRFYKGICYPEYDGNSCTHITITINSNDDFRIELEKNKAGQNSSQFMWIQLY